MPTAIETESPLGVFTIGNFPDKYIKPSGDITGATDTARINAALSQKGTFIFDDNGDYTLNNTVPIDPTSVYFQGNGAKFNISGQAIATAFLFDSTGSVNYKRASGRAIENFVVIGSQNSSLENKALRLNTPTGGDRSTSAVFRNICTEGFGNPIFIGANAYCNSFENLSIRNYTNVGILRSSFNNNGESIAFSRCTIFNGARAFWFAGPNGELIFDQCRFDYNQQVGYSDAIVEFHGVHFESGSNQTTLKRQFEVDNGGTMSFFGGDCGLVDWNGGEINLAKPPAPNLFTVWGQGGAFYNYGLKIASEKQHFTDKLCNVENGVFKPTMGAYNLVAPKSENVALTATASASFVQAGYEPKSATDGDRTGVKYGANGGWRSTQPLPQWLALKFTSAKTIKKVVVYSLRADLAIVDFKIQHLVSGNWVDLATITNNNLVMREIEITPTLMTDLRVFITRTVDGWSRIVEVEAWT